MKEFIYIYLIIGCYIAHRRTSKLDVNSKEFLISYVKTVVTYPIEILRELSNKKIAKEKCNVISNLWEIYFSCCNYNL